jgi:hypothetical protein
VITLIKTSSKRQTKRFCFKVAQAIPLNEKNSKHNSPFFDVVFTKSSFTDDALHELGLSEEYSFIGVVG